jgi:DNA-binding PadR family transcriptional regulator
MIRQALLSLLKAEPKYGYQLKSEFESATGSAWVLNIGQVYNTLGRMERDGVIVGLGEDEEGRPLYELAASGLVELQEWMAEAVARSTSTRDEVVMKVLMSASTGVADPADTIAIQQASSMQLLQEATQARSVATSLPDRLHLDRLIVTTNAELRWLDLAAQTIAEAQESGELLLPGQRSNSQPRRAAKKAPRRASRKTPDGAASTERKTNKSGRATT